MSKLLYPIQPVLVVDDELPWLRNLTILLEGILGINLVRQTGFARHAGLFWPAPAKPPGDGRGIEGDQ